LNEFKSAAHLGHGVFCPVVQGNVVSCVVVILHIESLFKTYKSWFHRTRT
jgi:hypothetical protein